MALSTNGWRELPATMLKRPEKDVKTPFHLYLQPDHTLKGVANCRETRYGRADAFEASFATTASATAEHVAATADTSSKIREGMVAVRVLDGIVQNKYSNDPGKLAAWL